MTFDDQLKRAFTTLTDRLRDEIDRQVSAAMDELSETARHQADAAHRDAADARRQAEDAHQQSEAARRELSEAQQQADAARREADEVRRETDGVRRDVAEANRRTEEALRHSEDVKRRADEALATAAATAAAAAAAATAPIAAPPAGDSAADDHLVAAIRAMDEARSLTQILDALVAAVAHDAAGAGVWLVRGGRLEHWRSTRIDHADAEIALDAPRAIADAARTNAAAWDDGFAVPLALAGQAVAVLYATSPQAPAPGPAAVELLARHAASRLEAVTAFKTARAMTERAAPSAESNAAVDLGDSEEHVSAQRYARLLVSEIKLYHEQAVIEGRRDRDLATRLGGEIARARVMYEQRVPSTVRERRDHFHDELVRTLADGDASLLELRT